MRIIPLGLVWTSVFFLATARNTPVDINSHQEVHSRNKRGLREGTHEFTFFQKYFVDATGTDRRFRNEVKDGRIANWGPLFNRGYLTYFGAIEEITNYYLRKMGNSGLPATQANLRPSDSSRQLANQRMRPSSTGMTFAQAAAQANMQPCGSQMQMTNERLRPLGPPFKIQPIIKSIDKIINERMEDGYRHGGINVAHDTVVQVWTNARDKLRDACYAQS